MIEVDWHQNIRQLTIRTNSYIQTNYLGNEIEMFKKLSTKTAKSNVESIIALFLPF